MFASLLASLAFASAPADCASARAPGELDAALAGVEAAWGVDEAAFAAGMGSARDVLACLRAPLTPTQAARYHRAEGLAAFLDKQTPAAARAFSAARAIDPTWRFPASMVPPGNPVEVAWDASPASPPPTNRAPPPRGGATLWIDGADTRARPADRPAVLQVGSRDGLTTSAWVGPTDPVPYPARGDGRRKPLLVAAGAAGLVAAGLYGGGVVSAHAWADATSIEEADALQGRTNTLVGASAGVAVLATGTLACAFVVGRW